MVWIVLGLLVALGFTLYQAYRFGKIVAFDVADEEIGRLVQKAEMRGALNVFKKKLDVLNASQKKMIGSLDTPSKGASHSLWKNEVADGIRRLEEEKMLIYKDILANGLDPSVSIYKDGQEEVVKLSEAVKRHEQMNNKEPLPPKRHLSVVQDTPEK